MALKKFTPPNGMHLITDSYIRNYISHAFCSTAKDLIENYTQDNNNRLDPFGGDFYVHGAKGDLPETMSVLFAASKNKNTLKHLEKYSSIADVLPFEYALFCLHVLLINGYRDEDIQRSIPAQLYNVNNIQALRFLDRVVTVLRLNLFVSISTIDVPDSVLRAWNTA